MIKHSKCSSMAISTNIELFYIQYIYIYIYLNICTLSIYIEKPDESYEPELLNVCLWAGERRVGERTLVSDTLG